MRCGSFALFCSRILNLIQLKRIVFLLILSSFGFSSLKAQLEVAHLSTKGFSSTGFGGFFNLAVPVDEGVSITGEFGVYFFKSSDNSIAMAPFLLGYRYMLDGSSTGWYVEPAAGYTIGFTDITKFDKAGNAMYTDNGDPLNKKGKGVTGALSSGYVFPGRISFNLGLRYQHVFVGGDPSLNMLSFRVSHSFSFGKRDSYY